MDQFHDGHHVWLRSRVHGTYLHADQDGHGVSLRLRRASMNAAWVVHRNPGDDQHVLLHSAAYGRYLAATHTSAPRGCRGFRVEQRNYDEELEEDAIRWQVLMNGPGDDILLRHGGGGRYGYLRANGRRLHWNERVVSVEAFENISTMMMQWVVVPIPSTELVPPLPRTNRLRRYLAESLAALALLPWRDVVLMGYGEEVYPTPVSLVFRGRSVIRLRNEVAYWLGILRVDRHDLVMYVRAGSYGRFTPLLVDLPRSTQTLAIRVELPANVEQQYPDVDAE